MNKSTTTESSPTIGIVSPSEEFDYYTGTVYWNDFEAVDHYINFAISNDKFVDWQDYLKKKFNKFETAFFINCGNGWVDRELFEKGVIGQAIGIDYSEKTIAEARSEAEKIGMPATYFSGDSNNFSTNDLKVDLVVNHAAMHHVACINRVMYQLSQMLGSTGKYVAFDYVGAHRNQYSWDAWSKMTEFNSSLPLRFQKKLSYPHLKTMLHTDPTEAIHSELHAEVLARYFEIEESAMLGGPIAYHLLFENSQLYSEQNTVEGAATIARIIEADQAYVAANPEANLFYFCVARPKQNNPPTLQEIEMWQKEEDEREEKAAQNGGLYYPKTALEIVYENFYSQIDSLTHRATTSSELHDKLLVQHQACVADLNRARDEHQTQIMDWQRQKHHLEHEVNTLKHEVNHFKTTLENEVLHAQTTINQIHNSTSWKITKPIRLVKRIFGKSS